MKIEKSHPGRADLHCQWDRFQLVKLKKSGRTTFRNLLYLGIFLSVNLHAQTNALKLLIPFLDASSQSNVIVSVSGDEHACPAKYTNVLSNTNLFTSEERLRIENIFSKYVAVTTNSGPTGAYLVELQKTNLIGRIHESIFHE